VGKNSSPRCDHCNRRIRENHHELQLADPLTGQRVGSYHTRPECQAAATKYMTGGTVLLLTYLHPDKCGPGQELCDGGFYEGAA
jgi:hypothetical protein